MASTMEPKFAEFDLTLTDRELEDFLVYMDHQTSGAYAGSLPQLPDAAADFPGLQLQPHSGSPSRSDGSESMGVDAPVQQKQQKQQQQVGGGAAAAFFGSSGSVSGGSEGAAGGGDANGGGVPQLPAAAAALMLGIDAMDVNAGIGDIAATLGDNAAMAVKPEPEPMDAAADTQQQQQNGSGAAGAGMQPAAGAAAAGASTPLAVPGTEQQQAHGAAAAMALPPGAVPSGLQQVAAGGSMALPVGQWPGAGPAGRASMQQLMFLQGPAALAAAQQQQLLLAQQQQAGRGIGQASAPLPMAGRGGASSSRGGGRADTAYHTHTHHHTAYSGKGGGQGQVSHSTVEKQRRDRLNSLIDELSDIVPPEDPKYGAEAASNVRRPKHVVLADTIAALRRMQTRLQLEEAEICTLREQAAVAAAMAAQQHSPQQAVALAAAAAAGSPGAGGVTLACAAALEEPLMGGGQATPALPLAPEGGVAATGVLVEQGTNCLYVKVNCKDRKGLLADVVSALRGMPVVIATAAITTTPDGKVHDVFEVRIEDESVTAEDIQIAVHGALFCAERLRGKRVRQDGSAA